MDTTIGVLALMLPFICIVFIILYRILAHARVSNNIKCCGHNYNTQIQKTEIEITPIPIIDIETEIINIPTAPIMIDDDKNIPTAPIMNAEMICDKV